MSKKVPIESYTEYLVDFQLSKNDTIFTSNKSKNSTQETKNDNGKIDIVSSFLLFSIVRQQYWQTFLDKENKKIMTTIQYESPIREQEMHMKNAF